MRRQRQAIRAAAWACALLALAGCATPPQAARPAAEPQRAAQGTAADDAPAPSDEHEAALRRLLASAWGERNDKDDQLRAPTPDWRNWKRVRYWGVQHFTGFRYGDAHDVMAIVFVQPVPAGESNDSRSCMRRFEAWGWPKVHSFEVSLSPLRAKRREYRGKPMLVKQLDGYVDLGLDRKFFSAAFAAYPAIYPDSCLIYGVAVPWRGHEQLAKQLRDRWVLEGFQRMRPLTSETPTRK